MTTKPNKNKVCVRDFESRSIIKEIDVSRIAGTTNYDRFVMGLLRNMDLDRFYLDDDEYQKEQAIKA